MKKKKSNGLLELEVTMFRNFFLYSHYSKEVKCIFFRENISISNNTSNVSHRRFSGGFLFKNSFYISNRFSTNLIT